MATLQTHTVTITINAPLAQVAADLADPTTHPQWATEFYAGPVRPTEGGEFIAPVPMMGGQVRHKIDADIARGILDLYFAPQERPMAHPSRSGWSPMATGSTCCGPWPGSRGSATRPGSRASPPWPASSRPSSAATTPRPPPTVHPPHSKTPARRTPRLACPGGRSCVLLAVPQEPATRQAMDARGARLWSQPEPHHCRFRRPRHLPMDSSPR